MTLTVPDRAVFLTFIHDDGTTNLAWASTSLQQATDLFFLATTLTDDPTDAQVLRIVQTAIMEMAFALLIRDDDREEMFSPFSGEHIGSYSYTKAASAISSNLPTGLVWWDLVVAYMRGLLGGSPIWGCAEQVMDPFDEGYWRGRVREQVWDRYKLLWGTDPALYQGQSIL